MSANTSADGLLRFFGSVPDKAGGRQPIERLIEALRAAGMDGLSYSSAKTLSGLPPTDFLDALSKGLSAGLLERFPQGDVDYLRLTKSALSLFSK